MFCPESLLCLSVLLRAVRELAQDLLRRDGDRGRHRAGTAEEIALEQVRAERSRGAQLRCGLDALRNDLHAALMRIGYDVAHDLLLVRVAFDAADDGNVDLDEIRVERDEVALIAVAAAVIVEREGTGAAEDVLRAAPR